ncbi:MAG TPA: glycosyltransferase family 2 protein [Thermoanaerobaculia bacterium]|nr:glycosyltransferase family 2 protein [Thermoanaerobaculia bacterium]
MARVAVVCLRGVPAPARGPRVISVVMSVYNGAAHVRASLKSVLAQTHRDLEAIVVDDGSTDATPRILADMARADSRVRVLTQENLGLTRALIRGCSEARGTYIARQDSGDRSHPRRLARQLEAFREGVVLVSCSTRYLGPEDEVLYEVEADGEEVRRSLLSDGIDRIRGLTHHGSAVFRRDAYVAAGGYRPQFRYAQDLDLWIRMAAIGEIVIVPEVLYEASLDPAAISARNRSQQIASASLALQLRDSSDPEPLLREVANIGPSAKGSARGEARALYFIASCLRRRGDPRWRGYARRAIRRDPLLLRTWLLFARRPR